MSPIIRAAAVLALVGTCLTGAQSALAQARSQDGENRTIRVHNQTGVAVRSLSAAPAPGAAYGADLLTGAGLDAGRSLPLTVDAGSGACVFTFRAVLANGQMLERPGVNVCRIADWYLTR